MIWRRRPPAWRWSRACSWRAAHDRRDAAHPMRRDRRVGPGDHVKGDQRAGSDAGGSARSGSPTSHHPIRRRARSHRPNLAGRRHGQCPGDRRRERGHAGRLAQRHRRFDRQDAQAARSGRMDRRCAPMIADGGEGGRLPSLPPRAYPQRFPRWVRRATRRHPNRADQAARIPCAYLHGVCPDAQALQNEAPPDWSARWDWGWGDQWGLRGEGAMEGTAGGGRAQALRGRGHDRRARLSACYSRSSDLYPISSSTASMMWQAHRRSSDSAGLYAVRLVACAWWLVNRADEYDQ